MATDPFQSGMSSLGGAVSDVFTGVGLGYQAEGQKLTYEQDLMAARYAGMEAQISQGVTTVNTAQAQRQAYQGVGRTASSVAGAGFGAGGSAGEILRMSAQQGALQAAVTKQTGQIATQGYQEEQKTYYDMAAAADVARHADQIAQIGSYVSAGIKGISAIASFMSMGG